ncbi:MAG: ABC-F family ATP-binding cassette domain-containing protein, partial [Clostridia bacterium]|nr:ABC-F family ATP-binding cassette domain-containing protein [Clostridia bacterium]
MSLMGFSNLSAGFGDNILFENASFDVFEKETVGVIGANGVGKTTLFKIITGECDDFTGDVIKQKDSVIGYMQQYACDGSELCVYDEALKVFENLREIELRLEEISRQIDLSGANEKLIDEQLILNEKYRNADGLSYKSRTRAALIGLGFTSDELSLPVKNLSGGQRSKLALCKLLLSRCDLMLLDEPTNHLDIESVEWLEDFIRDFKGAAMIISHDRFFLDRLTTKTVEIENKRITVRKGNYSRNAELKKLEKEA